MSMTVVAAVRSRSRDRLNHVANHVSAVRHECGYVAAESLHLLYISFKASCDLLQVVIKHHAQATSEPLPSLLIGKCCFARPILSWIQRAYIALNTVPRLRHALLNF